jgi:hypothetical protein
MEFARVVRAVYDGAHMDVNREFGIRTEREHFRNGSDVGP